MSIREINAEEVPIEAAPRGAGPLDAPHRAALPSVPQPSLLARYEALLVGTVSVAVFLVVWQAVAMARVVSVIFLPGPSDIFAAFVELLNTGSIWKDLMVSGQEFVVGYALAVVVGLPLGLIMGWYRYVRYALEPFVTFFYSTPRIALIPLLIIWFGIGIYSKIAMIFMSAVLLILVNTISGVLSVDAGMVKVARSFGASDYQIFRTIVLPGSVPFIIVGLRLAVGYALIGMVVGEMQAAQAGIGKMMAAAGQTFQTSKVFVGLFITAVVGLFFSFLLQRLERRFQSWRPAQ